ncbi:MAG TPA: CBS domain-containing protein [Thermodesulfovibrionales bacterium]|nr:CBS domain-containing protein [Thermodesulfovibrionales bacterium]
MEEHVRQLMRRGAITCNEETSLRDIAQIMVVNQVRYCAVINSNHEVRGLVSADSIIDAFGRDLDLTRAKDILHSHSIVTATAGTPLREAITAMSKNKIEHLIVIADQPESKAVLGLLCAGDLIARMAKREEGEANP